MNESVKARIDKLDEMLVRKLEENTGVRVFQDSVSEDEFNDELKGIYNYIIFETGGMKRADEKKFTLVQDVLVRFYGENVANVDHVQIDIITGLESCGYTFLTSDKSAIQKGKEDAFVDEVELNFTRSFKYVC